MTEHCPDWAKKCSSPLLHNFNPKNESKCDDCGLTIDEIFGLINCPLWVQELWEKHADKMQPLDVNIAINDYLSFMCMESQVVAEWLELDQLYVGYYNDKGEYCYDVKEGKSSSQIRFFSDEV
jgi:hypothetical protein